MRRALFGVMTAALAGCEGLYLDKGNAYPCDFSLGPGVRDEACFPGDVCGVDNLCRKYIYEGPRFEGTPQLPIYGPGTNAAATLHPLVMDKPITSVVADLPPGRTGFVYATDEGGTWLVSGGHVLRANVPLPDLASMGFGPFVSVQPYFREPAGVLDQGPPDVLVRDARGQLAMVNPITQRATVVRDGSDQRLSGARARVVPQPLPLRLDAGFRLPGADAIAWTDAELGRIEPLPDRGFGVKPWLTGVGPVLDVAGLSLRGRQWLVLLEPDELSVYTPADGGWETAATVEALASLKDGTLRTDADGRIIAATRRSTTPAPLSDSFEVLSTFQVNIGADGPELSSPWVDCTPCPAGQAIALMAPSVRSGAPTVELVCRNGPFSTAVRVVGSVALTQADACLTEPIDLPVPVVRMATLDDERQKRDLPVAWDSQSGLLVAGKAGELWAGETLSTLRPHFLDRVPRDVAPTLIDGFSVLAAMTDDSLMLQQTAELRPGMELLNGFRRVPPRELGIAESARLLGFVHDVAGWGITDTGELVNVGSEDGEPFVRAGPVLVTPSGDSIRQSLGGEALTEADGGAIGFFLAADDSLYFVPDPAGALAAQEQFVLTPDLTPEPSVPIRSLALERTPLGTDGRRYARGYLVTSRNVFEWSLGGEPSRWSATPVQLSSGQPVEVWFDSRLSALARVGYADGEVYTLPSGFLLTYPIPESGEGEASTVLDYENLGGWPVAYTTTGLYIAQWDLQDGKLQNRFPETGARGRPMSWRKVTLPDGTEPWMQTVRGRREARQAKLFVAKDPKNVDNLTPFRLLVFLDDKVLQVATNLRK